jgi:hypothetical protein
MFHQTLTWPAPTTANQSSVCLIIRMWMSRQTVAPWDSLESLISVRLHGIVEWHDMNQILHMIDSKCDQRGMTHRIPIKYARLLATLRGIDLREIIFPSSSHSCGIEEPDWEKMAICTALGSDNSWARQLRTSQSLSDHFCIKIPQNTSVGVLQSARVAVIVAKFCPLQIIQCKYMVQLREKTRTWPKGTNSKSRPWIERLHNTANHTVMTTH